MSEEIWKIGFKIGDKTRPIRLRRESILSQRKLKIKSIGKSELTIEINQWNAFLTKTTNDYMVTLFISPYSNWLQAILEVDVSRKPFLSKTIFATQLFGFTITVQVWFGTILMKQLMLIMTIFVTNNHR